MKTTLSAPRDRWMRLLVAAWALVGLLLLLVAAGWLIGRLMTALVPFLLALVLVFTLRGPVASLERRGMKRGLAVGLCYLVGFGILGLVIGFLVPALTEQVRQFIQAFPGYYERASELLLDMQSRYRSLVVPPWVEDALANMEETITTQSAEWSAVLAREIFSVGGSAVSLLGTSVLALVAGFWILKDLPVINAEMLLLAGPGRREEAAVITAKVSRILGGYLRGQIVLSVATGILVAIGLTIVGVPYSLVIGLLAAVLNVIPWIGPALTALIAGIAAAFVSPLHIVFAAAICIGSQQVTEIFIQPRVMSEQVDLHPIVVIFSLLAGSTLFGFAGLVLAIPVAAIAKGLFVYFFEKYTDSTLATEDGALFRAQPDACAPADVNAVADAEPCTTDDAGEGAGTSATDEPTTSEEDR